MSVKSFVDSNIWLYAFMDQGEEKREKALEVISKANIISTQVINEVCTNLIRKAAYTEAEIQQAINNIKIQYEVVPIGIVLCLDASKLRASYSLSYWDSLIVATANDSACEILYSEDMQHNQLIENTRIINPFV